MPQGKTSTTYDLGHEWEATFETRIEGIAPGRKAVETLTLRNAATRETIKLGGDSLLTLRKIFRGSGR